MELVCSQSLYALFSRCFALTHNDSFLHTPENRLKTLEKLCCSDVFRGYDRGLSTVFLFSIAKWREKN